MADAGTKGLQKPVFQSQTSKDHRVRLNKLLSEEGYSSRRAADRLIEEGRVTINGKRVYELGIRVDPKLDRILIDGKPLRKNIHGKIVAMFHKPKGVLTTMEDPLGRPTIKDYIKHLPVRLFPVGRLDWDSEGLLLLTNDGEFAQKITHPSTEVTKTYLVKVDGSPRKEDLEKLRNGVSIIGGKAKALVAARFDKGESKKYSWVKVVITEGKNRMIRLMFEKIGFDVLKLQRIAIGRLRLGALKKGELVILNEVAAERALASFAPPAKINASDEDAGEAVSGFSREGAPSRRQVSTGLSQRQSKGRGKSSQRSTASRQYEGGKRIDRRPQSKKRQPLSKSHKIFED